MTHSPIVESIFTEDNNNNNKPKRKEKTLKTCQIYGGRKELIWGELDRHLFFEEVKLKAQKDISSYSFQQGEDFFFVLLLFGCQMEPEGSNTLPCSGVEIILPSSSNYRTPSTSVPPANHHKFSYKKRSDSQTSNCCPLYFHIGALLFEELMTSSFSSHLFSLFFCPPYYYYYYN